MKKYYLLAFSLFFFIKTSAQTTNEATTGSSTIHLGIEAGCDNFEAKAKHLDRTHFVMALIYPRPTTIVENMKAIYVGVKPEFIFAKNRFGISTGIRVSQYSSRFDTKYYNIRSMGDFVWFYDDEYKKCLPLTNITQESYFAGIPLELKYFLIKEDKLLQPYLKLSAGFNFLIHTKNDLEIWTSEFSYTYNSNDEPVTSEQEINLVKQQIGDPGIFNVRTSLALGFKIGYSKYLFGNVEIHLPFILNAKNVSSFVEPNEGVGFQCSLQIPLKNLIK